MKVWENKLEQIEDHKIECTSENYFEESLKEVKKQVTEFDRYEVIRKGNPDDTMASSEITIYDKNNEYIARAVFYSMFDEYAKIRIDYSK